MMEKNDDFGPCEPLGPVGPMKGMGHFCNDIDLYQKCDSAAKNAKNKCSQEILKKICMKLGLENEELLMRHRDINTS